MAGRLSFAAGQSRCLCCCRLSSQYEHARHERRLWHIPHRPGSLALIVFSFLGFVSFGNIDCFVMYFDFMFSNCCLTDRPLRLIDSSSFRTLCTYIKQSSFNHVHVYLVHSIEVSRKRGMPNQIRVNIMMPIWLQYGSGHLANLQLNLDST